MKLYHGGQVRDFTPTFGLGRKDAYCEEFFGMAKESRKECLKFRHGEAFDCNRTVLRKRCSFDCDL